MTDSTLALLITLALPVVGIAGVAIYSAIDMHFLPPPSLRNEKGREAIARLDKLFGNP